MLVIIKIPLSVLRYYVLYTHKSQQSKRTRIREFKSISLFLWGTNELDWNVAVWFGALDNDFADYVDESSVPIPQFTITKDSCYVKEKPIDFKVNAIGYQKHKTKWRSYTFYNCIAHSTNMQDI